MERTPFWTWKDIFYAAMLAVPFVFIGVTLSALLLPAGAPKAVRLLAPQFAGLALALIPVEFLFRVRYEVSLWRSVNFGVPPREWYQAAVSGFALAVGILALGALLRPPRIQSPLQELMDDPASRPYLVIAAVTLAPVFEELIFRGLLQPLLVKATGSIAGVGLAALPFALLHGPEYAWSWRHVTLIMVAGLGFGVKRLRSGSTGASALMHSAYNAVNTTVYLFARNFIDG